jgi:hypothetical protein
MRAKAHEHELKVFVSLPGLTHTTTTAGASVRVNTVIDITIAGASVRVKTDHSVAIHDIAWLHQVLACQSDNGSSAHSFIMYEM